MPSDWGPGRGWERYRRPAPGREAPERREREGAPAPVMPPPVGEDMFAPFGGQEAWLRQYAAEHEGMLPGMPGAESWESAMASLAWSQQYAGQYGRAPTQQEWEQRWYETEGWSPEGRWRQWLPTEMPTPWWERLAVPSGAAAEAAMPQVPPEAQQLVPPELRPERPQWGRGLMAAPQVAPGVGAEYLRMREEQLRKARVAMREWETQQRQRPSGGAVGKGLSRLEFSIAPGYPSVLDPGYTPSRVTAGNVLTTSIQSGTTPYAVPPGVLRTDVRVPLDKVEDYNEMRAALGTRFDELDGAKPRAFAEARKAALDIAAGIHTAVMDYVHETEERWEKAGGVPGAAPGEPKWWEQLGIPYEAVLNPAAQQRARQIRATTNQVVIDLLWDWPIAVCRALDQAWGAAVIGQRIGQAKEDLVRLRELEAMGITDTDSLMEQVRAGKPFNTDDFDLLTEYRQERAEALSEGEVTLGEWQGVKDLYQTGRLGWTFNKHPERFTAYMNALRDPGFSMERFIDEYEDQGAELIGALLNPINFALPVAVQDVLFPAGKLAGPVLEVGLKGAGAVMRKVPVLKYLTEVSKRSKMVAATDEAYDVIATLTLRAEPEGVSKVSAVGQLLIGDESALKHLPEGMREKAIEVGTRLNQELGKRQKSATYDDLWEWVYPQIKKQTEDPAVLAELIGASEPAKVVAQAYRRAVAEELGLAWPKGAPCLFEQRWRAAGAVLKDNWLSLLGAFHLTNDLGDRTRMALRGLDPFRFPSQMAAERTFTDYGIAMSAIDHTYMDDLLERFADVPGPTAQLPIPGVGKPRYAIDALSKWLGFDVGAKGPVAYAARVTTGAQPPFQGTIGEAVGKAWVWMAGNANIGSLNDFAAHYGSMAEGMRRRSTALQLWEKGVGEARAQWLPNALEQVRGLGLSQGLADDLAGELRVVKNPTHIRELANKYIALPDLPVPPRPPADAPIDATVVDMITDRLTEPDGSLVEDVNTIFNDARAFYDSEYRYLVLEGIDEATSFHRFLSEYFEGMPASVKPKNLDLMQKLRVAAYEDKLKRVTMYDVSDTYMMARIGEVAQTGETTGIFGTYFEDVYLTTGSRKEAAEQIIRDFNAKKVSKKDIMEAITESYNTMLKDMGVPRQYDYAQAWRIKGETPVYHKWLEAYKQQGIPFAALSDGRQFWYADDPMQGLAHWEILNERKLELSLMELSLVAQGGPNQAVTIRAASEEQALETFSRLTQQGIPEGTTVDMLWPDVSELGGIGQKRLVLGGGEPTAAQQFAETTPDALDQANAAMRAREAQTAAQEADRSVEDIVAELRYKFQRTEDQPAVDALNLSLKESIAKRVEARELAPKILLNQRVMTSKGPGIVKEVLFEGTEYAIELGDGTVERFTREFVTSGMPQLTPEEEAELVAWKAFNEAFREEWRAHIDQQVEGVLNWLEDWRDNAVFARQNYITGQWMAGKKRETLVPILESLADEWSEALEKTRLKTLQGLNDIMFDYSRKNNLERHLEVLAPFTTYQFRSIPFFAAEAATNWRIPRAFDLYDRWTEFERESRGLSARFKGTFPLPFQKQLQERVGLPEGYWAMDPKSLMLWQGSVREPFETPGEKAMPPGMQAARAVATAPEQVGVRYWPWAQIPLEMAGVYGPRETGRIPWQIGGVPSRVFPQLEEPLTRLRGWRPLQAEKPWQDLARTMETPSKENWARSYYVNVELAGMAQRGEISVEDARAAQYDPAHPAYAEAARRYDKLQGGMSAARMFSPFGFKYSSPAEQALRGGQLEEGVPELWWRARQAMRPEEERLAEFQTADRRREYMTQLRQIQHERDRRLEGLKAGSRPWEQVRDNYNAQIEQLTGRYEDVIEGFPERKGIQKLFEEIDVDKFTLPGGEVDWDAYNEAKEALYRRLEEAEGERQIMGGVQRAWPPTPLAFDQARVKKWQPQRIGYEAHQEWLRGGQEKFFSEQEKYDDLREQIEAVRADLSLTPEERRRKEQLLQDKLDEIQARRDAVLAEYGERPMEQYWPYIQQLRPDLAQDQAIYRAMLENEPPAAGLQAYWLRNLPEEGALGRALKNAFYAQSDATQRLHRQDLGSDFAEWLRGETTPERQQLEEWALRIPGAEETLREAGVPLRRYGLPALAEDLSGRRWAPPGKPSMLAPAAPEYEQTFAAATKHMREWRLGERSDWSNEMQEVFGDPQSPRSQWFEQMGRVMPYIDWEALNDDRDASALLSGIAGDEYYEQEAAQGFPTLMKYVDQARLGAESATVRAAADRVEAEWPSVPEELQDAQTMYFRARTGYDKQQWREANPEAYAKLEGAWDAQLKFQWENPEYTYIHRPENFHKWWGEMTPEEVRGRLDENKALVTQALDDMEAYETARAAGEYGEWTDAMSKVFEDPGKASVRFWGAFHQIPPGSWGQPIENLNVVQWIRSPFTQQFVKWEIPDDLYNQAISEIERMMSEYNANPDVPHWDDPGEVDRLWELRDKYFKIRNYEEEYPTMGVYDPVQFARDNPLLIKWYPYFDRDWGSRPMNPHTGYETGGGEAGGGPGGGSPPPVW